MKYKKANVEVVDFNKNEIFLTASKDALLQEALAWLKGQGFECRDVHLNYANTLYCTRVYQIGTEVGDSRHWYYNEWHG